MSDVSSEMAGVGMMSKLAGTFLGVYDSLGACLPPFGDYVFLEHV